MFNLKGFRRLLVGEAMPDKEDPKYKDRYLREVAAGTRFAEATGLAWLLRHYTSWAERHKELFFVIILSLMFLFAIGNVYRLCTYSPSSREVSAGSAVARQDSVLHPYFMHNRKPIKYEAED